MQVGIQVVVGEVKNGWGTRAEHHSAGSPTTACTRGLAELSSSAALPPLNPQLPNGAGPADTVHVEVRLRAAGPGQGLLSAAWMLPASPAAYGESWPLSGEVRGPGRAAAVVSRSV